MAKQIVNTPRLQDISDAKSRDLLRGLLSKKADHGRRAAFLRLMHSVPLRDVAALDANLRTNPLFGHLTLSPEFPRDASPFVSADAFVPIPGPDARVDYVRMRGDACYELVCDALSGLDTINRRIIDGDDIGILAETSRWLERHGHSLALARKYAFILGYFEKESQSWRTAQKLFASYGADANNYGAMALADSIGSEFEYLDLKAGFDDYANPSSDASTSQNLAWVSFHPIAFRASDIQDSIAIHYACSLTDAVLHLLVHRELKILEARCEFHPAIESTWERIRSTPPDFTPYFSREKKFSDLQAFRAAPAFLEYDHFRNFRAALQQIYDDPAIRAREVKVPTQFESQFFHEATAISTLVPPPSRTATPLPTGFDSATAGVLARSCALAKVAEACADFGPIGANDMARLMGATTDIDRLLPTASLRSAAASANDPFTKLMLLTLIRAHSPATRDGYQFKDAFQRYVSQHHSGDVVAFLDAIRSVSKEIVWYFVTLLDETMLSQMPFLVATADGVYETRALILEWHTEKTGDGSSRDKAKQLRIDRKLAAVRGQINETRLNIDGVRFRQWIELTKVADFSGFIRQEKMSPIPQIEVSDKKALAEVRLGAHRDPVNRALVALMDCYREFCANPDFGVASYLGRRIRHGTLRGTLLDGLPDERDYDLTTQTLSQYRHWRAAFASSIGTITGRLHFNEKGAPKGAMISSEIDTKEKWDALVVCLHKIYEEAQSDKGVATIASYIEQYCWFIFEVELRAVRDRITECRNQLEPLKIKHPPGDMSAISFERDVNISLSATFNAVASWFNKPPNISPVAQLSDIIEVVLREASAESQTYRPNVKMSGTDIELSGGVYYHVYDALTIIVRNAARHGAQRGTLTIVAEVEDRETGSVLRIDIASPTRSGDSAIAAVARMERAGLPGPANADVVEGRSGVRKLKKMKLERAIHEFEVRPDTRKGQFLVVSIWLALTGLVP